MAEKCRWIYPLSALWKVKIITKAFLIKYIAMKVKKWNENTENYERPFRDKLWEKYPPILFWFILITHLRKLLTFPFAFVPCLFLNTFHVLLDNLPFLYFIFCLYFFHVPLDRYWCSKTESRSTATLYRWESKSVVFQRKAISLQRVSFAQGNHKTVKLEITK